MLQTSTHRAPVGAWVTANNGDRADLVLDSGAAIRIFRACSLAPLSPEQFRAVLPIGRLAPTDLELERLTRAQWEAFSRIQ